MILPIPKAYERIGEVCLLPREITVSGKGDFARLGIGALELLFEDVKETDKEGFVEFEYDGSLENKSEIYKIIVSKYKIKVLFRDARGAVNGAASVALLLMKGEIACGTITDHPDCEYRSFLLDMARGVPDFKDIYRTVKYMALAKYNRLHLHLIDSKGPCYKSAVLPEYKDEGGLAQCEISDLGGIVELCKRFAIEVVPEIEVPAHATAFCKAYPQFKCQVENAHVWTVCPGNDDIWKYYELLLGEIAEIFPESEYIHIGSDELEFSDLEGASKRLCHWDDCPRCAALRAREGLADRQAEFYYVIDKIHGIVRSLGKKMIMWNDQIDVSKDVPISRDILIQFWRVACPGRGPYEGCSFEDFLKKGFKVINSFYRNTYIDIEKYMDAEKMKTWSPISEPSFPPELKDGIVGGEMCAWEFGNVGEYPFYGYVIPPALAIFADKLWSFGEREYTQEYMSALSLFVFGRVCENDVFSCIGSPIPPRKKDEVTYVAPENILSRKVDECICELRCNSKSFFGETADIYARLLERIK